MEIIKMNVKGYYFYCPPIENYEKHLNKQKLIGECAICKRCVLEASYEIITDNSKINTDIQITTGKCGHMFHSECINSWLKTCNICPIDKVKWQTFRNVDTTTKLILNQNEKCENIKSFDEYNFNKQDGSNKNIYIKKMKKKNGGIYPGEQN